MIIDLEPGDYIKVRFEGTDGEFEVHFDSSVHPNALLVKETAGITGDIGKANEVLYLEEFSE